MQRIEVSDKEQLKMYNKLSKQVLSEMLLSCNKHLSYFTKNPRITYTDNFDLKRPEECSVKPNKGMIATLKELSELSRETKNASFIIQHYKNNGTWIVNFNNHNYGKNESLSAKTSFYDAINDAIIFLKNNRTSISNPLEKYIL